MRKIDLAKDREFYATRAQPPKEYHRDPLDSWRFNLALGLCRRLYKDNVPLVNKTILNVGGGWGREAYLLLEQHPLFLILTDYSFTQVNSARRYLGDFVKKSFVCSDGQFLPFKDKSIDICFVSESLHHFSDPEKGIREILRVTRETVFIDEPRQGRFNALMNSLFIKLKVKEKYERGYLEAFRFNKEIIKKAAPPEQFRLIFFPYFIYYFDWYKKTNSRMIKSAYKAFLALLNMFFHSLGNRVIAVIGNIRE